MTAASMQQPVSIRNSDEALLRAFINSGSEKAFCALVEKYLGMVLGIATRRTGDCALAEEISQDVFTVLARKAKRLKPGCTLAGWIHRVTVIECAEAMRRKVSHQTKMNAISRHLLVSELDGRDVWRDALPLLDEGIDSLNRAEREVVLLRFFERKSFREIGSALGKSEDAAQKQTERALEKLSKFLKRKGVFVSATVLSAGLSTHLAHAASSAVTHVVTHAALSAASTFDAKLLILKTLQAMTNTKLKTAMAVTAALTIPIVAQWAENNRLREALNSTQQQQQQHDVLGSFYDARRDTLKPFHFASISPAAGIPASGFSSLTSSVSTPDQSTDSDPASTAHDWEHVLFIADPLHRSQRLSQLLATLTAENAPQAAEAFERVKKAGIKFAEEQRLFLRAWGKLDGAAATQYAVGLNGQSSDEAIAALGGWAAAAPHSAKEWLEALPDSKSKETLVCGLLDGWSTVDFRAAAAYAESRPSSPARDKFRELLLQRALRSGGIAAAQSWVVGMSEDDQNRDYKKRAFGDVIQAMLYRDPASAVRWISELEGQAYVGNEAVTGTAMKLAESSPVDALSWLTTLNLADANSAGRSAGAVLQNWAQMNPEAAGNWLQQNARHPFYDQMTASYARAVASTDRNAANEWLQTISNAQLRQETLASLDQRNTATIRFATYEDTYSTFITELTRLDNVNTLALSGSVSPVEVESAPVLRAQLDSPHEVTTKRNPHGTEAKWNNCASCHKQ